jgi:hypothetical protein
LTVDKRKIERLETVIVHEDELAEAIIWNSTHRDAPEQKGFILTGETEVEMTAELTTYDNGKWSPPEVEGPIYIDPLSLVDTEHVAMEAVPSDTSTSDFDRVAWMKRLRRCRLREVDLHDGVRHAGKYTRDVRYTGADDDNSDHDPADGDD